MAAAVVDDAVMAGRLVREGDIVRRPGSAPRSQDPAIAEAMDRLEAALVTVTPPLAETARSLGCPPEGIRALEKAGRIAVLEADLAYAMATYRDLAAQALVMASTAPLTPATYRDATGTSRKYVMAILEDLDRRGILRRTPDGHVPVRGLRSPRHDDRARGDRPRRRSLVALRSRQARRTDRGTPDARSRRRAPAPGRHRHRRSRINAGRRRHPADVSVAQDDVPFGGPLAGLAAGLRSLDPALERVLVVGGDMPTLVPAVLERLVSGIGRREAAVLADADGPRPLPLAVRRSVASPAAQRVLESGERRLRALLGELDVEVIPPDTGSSTTRPVRRCATSTYPATSRISGRRLVLVAREGDPAVIADRPERVPGHLPVVPVRVGEVAGIAAPVGLDRRLDDAGAAFAEAREDRIDLVV